MQSRLANAVKAWDKFLTRFVIKSPNASLTCLFGTFVFLQFTVLGLANHAGEGFLSVALRELVYYLLQVFVILGYLLHSLFAGLYSKKIPRRRVAYGVCSFFLLCVTLMLVTGRDQVLSVIASMACALSLGAVGGMVHFRMSMATVTGAKVARSMGIGSALAVVMQYLLQIQWGVTPLLHFFMLAAFLPFFSILLGKDWETAYEGEETDFVRGYEAGELQTRLSNRIGGLETGFLEEPDFVLSREPDEITNTALEPSRQVESVFLEEKNQDTPPRRIVFAVLIATSFILFTCFYNEMIHHLMIQSNYGAYNVYSWPRLMMVPGYLLFAAIGDCKNGKYVPIASLCIMLIALLNVVLSGSQSSYWFNMCLFYLSIGVFTSYYLLTFWRLAPGTKQPALWAPMGRILDSCMVLMTGMIRLSTFPATVVLGLDIVGVAMVILLMAIEGDFNLNQEESGKSSDGLSKGTEGPFMEQALCDLSEEDKALKEISKKETEQNPKPIRPEEILERMREKYQLTLRETDALRELVLTEDTQVVISERLSIQVKTLQAYVTRLYSKTGASTRVGLCELYHENRMDLSAHKP